MKINLVAVGTKMPAWVTDAWKGYARRFPPDWQVKLIEIPPQKRLNAASIERALLEEGKAILDKTNTVTNESHLIAWVKHKQA